MKRGDGGQKQQRGSEREVYNPPLLIGSVPRDTEATFALRLALLATGIGDIVELSLS